MNCGLSVQCVQGFSFPAAFSSLFFLACRVRRKRFRSSRHATPTASTYRRAHSCIPKPTFPMARLAMEASHTHATIEGGSYGLSTSNQIGYVYVRSGIDLQGRPEGTSPILHVGSLLFLAVHLRRARRFDVYDSASVYTYTDRNGIVARFQAPTVTRASSDGPRRVDQGVSNVHHASPTAKAPPTRTRWRPIAISSSFTRLTYGRLQTVYNNFGYRLWFSYPGSVLSLG